MCLPITFSARLNFLDGFEEWQKISREKGAAKITQMGGFDARIKSVLGGREIETR